MTSCSLNNTRPRTNLLPKSSHGYQKCKQTFLRKSQCQIQLPLIQMETKELIGVYIKRIEVVDSDFFLCEPSIEVYFIDKTTGSSVKGNSSDSNIHSYKSPFTLTQLELGKRSVYDNWNKLVVIDEKFDDLNSESKLLIFEICKKFKQRKNQDLENRRISWAFLIPLASDGSMNTNQDLKLQLFKVRKDCKISHQDCNIFHLFSEHKPKKLIGYLQVSVKGVVPNDPKPLEKVEENEKEETTLEEKPTVEVPSALKSSPKTLIWSRHPTQSCRVPNKIHKSYSLGKNGVSCLQFSRNGLHVAAAVLSKIVIHEVISGLEVITLNSHIGFIYELDWSFDDQYLLSVSNDCRGAIWSLFQKTPLFVLPHPSYVYCGKWFGSNEQIVTGGKDHMLRFWCKNGGAFDLLEEIPGHSGFVSALATQDDSFVFSGDSHGCVMIRKYSEGNFTLLKELSFSEISKNVVDSIHLHSSRRRIVVSVRSRGSYLVDVVSGIILQTYKSCVNVFVRLISCLTPCGSLLYSFRQNGDVGVWEVNTGRLLATYDNLFPFDRVFDLSGCVHYHPHEHMVAITALGQSCPILLLKYDMSSKGDSEKLGLTFTDKNSDDCSQY